MPRGEGDFHATAEPSRVVGKRRIMPAKTPHAQGRAHRSSSYRRTHSQCRPRNSLRRMKSKMNRFVVVAGCSLTQSIIAFHLPPKIAIVASVTAVRVMLLNPPAIHRTFGTQYCTNLLECALRWQALCHGALGLNQPVGDACRLLGRLEKEEVAPQRAYGRAWTERFATMPTTPPVNAPFHGKRIAKDADVGPTNVAQPCGEAPPIRS